METALRNFIRYRQLHVQGATVNLAVEGNIATLTWHVDDPGMDALDHIGDGALATLYNIMHELCGSDWRPSEVRFAHRRPLDAGPYRRFFRVPLRFDAETYALSFSAGLLKHRLPGIDDEMRSLLEREIGSLEDRYRDDFPAQVRSLLRTALMAGRHKAEEVAALLGMHSRTLNRRLNAFGVGFQQLLDETRFEIARQMLEYSAQRGRRDLGGARLRGAGRLHEGVQALERDDTRRSGDWITSVSKENFQHAIEKLLDRERRQQ